MFVLFVIYLNEYCILLYIVLFIDCIVDETIVAVPAEKEDTEDTQIKPEDAGETLEVPPSERTRTKSPIPSPVHMLTIVAEAGGSARHLLANIRSRKSRGMPCYNYML